MSANFLAAAPVPIGGSTVTFTRGYSYVTATVDGVSFIFANSHLEVGGAAVQAQIVQSQELRTALGVNRVDNPVILVGDFNSDPEESGDDGESYRVLTAATENGFGDVWTEVRGSADGPTCCHAADLLNPLPTLTTRIDLILSRGAVTAESIDILGDEPADRTAGGLWPSDHAGVVATLTVQN